MDPANVPASAKASTAAPTAQEISVCSWNVLADAYSHGLTNVPHSVTCWQNRSAHIQECIQRYTTDIICLQEADHYYDFYEPLFQDLGFHSVYLQRPQRQDGCLIAFRKSRFNLIGKVEIFMDDLVELINSVHLRESFLKQNVALIVHLRDAKSGEEIAVSTVHIYWNPMKPEVKTAQCRYLLDRMEQYLLDFPSVPAIITGDFNSLPNGELYKIITAHTKIKHNVLARQIIQPTDLTGLLYGPDTKFLCDHSLVRLCRWMRALGIDTALQDGDLGSTEILSGKIQSTKVPSNVSRKPKKDFSMLFERARKEKRVIVTTSRSMMERANCPQSYFVSSEKMKFLEGVLADICREFGLALKPDKFLTVCGKCGGEITPCAFDDPRILQKHVPKDKQVYICADCCQAYWWDDREDSSPARAMKMAGKLYSTVMDELQRPVSSSLGSGSSLEFSASKSTTDTASLPDPPDRPISVDKPHLLNSRGGPSYSSYSHRAPSIETDPQVNMESLSEMMKQRDNFLLSRDGSVSTAEFRSGVESTSPVPSDISTGVLDFATDMNGTDVTEDKIIQMLEESGCPEESWLKREDGISRRPWLKSAYKTHFGKEPKATNWGGEFQGYVNLYTTILCRCDFNNVRRTLDYIFVSSELRVADAFVLPQLETDTAHAEYEAMSIVNGISEITIDGHHECRATYEHFRSVIVTSSQPSAAWPSDHFIVSAIVCL
jgi:mRNA deadenylase 3'-5' endonuclease subunit Ccr4/uncharacterized protein with PIN domain